MKKDFKLSGGQRRTLMLHIALIGMLVTVILLGTIVTINTALRKDREIHTDLIFSLLYSSVRNEFDKPVHVTATMAGDPFFLEFVRQEGSMPQDEFDRKMTDYLNSVKEGNSFEAAYYSSAKTLRYYSQKGFEKIIDPANEQYDQWYTRFVESGDEYDLDVAFDIVNEDIWTIFVDRRMEDENGQLLGVCTVGLKISSIQEDLTELEKENDVDIFFTDEKGKVQVDFGEEKKDLFYLNVDLEHDLTKRNAYYQDGGYVISQYIPLLGWHLVVWNNQGLLSRVVSRLVYMGLGLMLFFSTVFILIYAFVNARTKNRLHNAAETDSMTQVLNRSGAEKRIREMLDGRDSRERGGTLFVVDMDHFKEVNDTLGHAAGDEVLIETAKRLKNSFRDGDVIGRLGGDEFIIYSPGIRNDDTIRRKAEILNLSGRQNIERGGKKVKVSLSVGAAVFPEHADGYEELCKKADQAMYAVKEAGRDGYCIYEKTILHETT